MKIGSFPVNLYPCIHISLVVRLEERGIIKKIYRIYPAIRRGFCPSGMTSNN